MRTDESFTKFIESCSEKISGHPEAKKGREGFTCLHKDDKRGRVFDQHLCGY